MEIAFWAATDVGRVREHNEDNFLVDKRLRLFIVCDGMGGHAAGEVASAMSVRIVREVISSQRDLIDQLNNDPTNVELGQSMLRTLEFAVQEANRRVFESSRDDEKRRGMGTTCCVLLLTNKKAFIAHVGDSRIYLMRQQHVHQLTEDHSLYNEMVRLGKIRPGEPVNLPNKNAVTRAVGVREVVEVDGLEFEIFEEDRFLICSDGLCGYFKADEQIRMMLNAGDVKDVTELSIAFALESGGKDNVTAIVVDVVKQEALVQSESPELGFDGIQHIPYFQYLTLKEKKQVLGLAQKMNVAPGTSLDTLGDEEIKLCVVLEGLVELRREDRVIDVLEPGGYTGEIGFIDGQPNPLDAVAVEESVILAFSRRKFMELLRQSPELAVKLMWNFLQMFTINIRELTNALLTTPEPAEPSAPQEEMVQTATVPTLDAMEDHTIPPSSLSLVSPSESALDEDVEEVPVAQSPRVVIGAGSDLNETTEAPSKANIHLQDKQEDPVLLNPPSEPDLFPEESEEDLRATIQLEWDSNGELLERPLGEVDPNDSLGPPPLPALSPKMPPLPPRKPRTTQPIGKGISGESNTQTVEAAAVARDDIATVEVQKQAPVEDVRSTLPPMAAVMKRSKRRTEPIQYDDRPLSSHGLHSSSEAVVDRSDLVTTVQLDLNELDFEEEPEAPTKQLERPSFDVFADMAKKDPAPGPSPKVQINFGDEN